MKDREPRRIPFLTKAIILNGMIEGEVQTNFSLLLENEALKRKNITLVIDSPGGDVDDLLLMQQEMDRVRNKYHSSITTVARGKVYSAAACLVSWGDKGKRFAYPDTTFYLHNMQVGVEGDLKDVRNAIAEATHQQRRIERILASNSGRSVKEIKSLYNKFLTPQQAMEAGLIDGIYKI